MDETPLFMNISNTNTIAKIGSNEVTREISYWIEFKVIYWASLVSTGNHRSMMSLLSWNSSTVNQQWGSWERGASWQEMLISNLLNYT